jgi:hypothetical protein
LFGGFQAGAGDVVGRQQRAGKPGQVDVAQDGARNARAAKTQSNEAFPFMS